MAFPSITGSVTATNGTSAAASKTINLPSGMLNGEIVCVLMRTAGAGAHTFPAGWSKLFDDASDASDDQTVFAYAQVESTFGSTISVSSANNKFAALTWRVSGAADPTVRPPEFATLVTGASTTPDPGNCTPTGGAKDYLWIWCGAWEGEQTSPPASAPTNYSGTNGADSGTSGLATTNVRVAMASRTNNAASENAGSWTISASDDWTATTVAFHPAEAVTAGLESGRRVSSNVLPTVAPKLATAALTITLGLLQSTLAPEPVVEAYSTEQATVLFEQRPPQSWEYRNSLILEPVESPFRQSEWPLPVLRVPTLLTSHEPYSGDIPEPAVEQDPFRQSNWPVPPRIPRVALGESRGADLSYQILPYRPGETFPLPDRRIQPAPKFENQSFILSTVEVTPPFYQNEWPNPVRRIGTLLTDHETVGERPEPEVPAGTPFSQTSWPLPHRRTPPTTLESPNGGAWFQLTPYRAADLGDMFALPVRRPFIGVKLESRNFTLENPVPFNQRDWPVVRPKRGNPDWSYSLLGSTLAPVAYVLTVDPGTVLIGAVDIQLTWSGESLIFRLPLLGVG